MQASARPATAILGFADALRGEQQGTRAGTWSQSLPTSEVLKARELAQQAAAGLDTSDNFKAALAQTRAAAPSIDPLNSPARMYAQALKSAFPGPGTLAMNQLRDMGAGPDVILQQIGLS